MDHFVNRKRSIRTTHLCSISDDTLRAINYVVIFRLQEQRTRAESKSTEHKIKMQFFLCYNTLFFKHNISICYNINVLYCCISKFKLHNETKKIAFSLIQHILF